MSREADLRAQIFAAPGDDGPRLAYAELLAARGDPRGEFIRVQCAQAAAAGAGDAAGEADLKARALVLFAKHGASWAAPLPCSTFPGSTWPFERGFLHTVLADGKLFLAARQRLREEPIRDLTLMGNLNPFLKEVTAAPELARIERLKLSGPHPDEPSMHKGLLGDEGLAAFAASPHLTGLRSLEVGFNHIGPAGARALAGATWLRQLTELRLLDNALGDDGAAALAAAAMPSLEVLRLPAARPVRRSGQPIGPAGAGALAASRSLAALRWLDLSGNSIKDEGAVAIARSPHLPSLNALGLSFNLIHDAGAMALADAKERAGLVRLGLAGNGIGTGGAAALAASKTLVALRELDLRQNQLLVEGVTALAVGTGLPALHLLGASGNKIFTDEIEEDQDYDGTVTGRRLKEESFEALKARFAAKPQLEFLAPLLDRAVATDRSPLDMW